MLLTFPEYVVGNRNMVHAPKTEKGKKKTTTSHNFAKKISKALFVYLRLDEGDHLFDSKDAMPPNHPEYGVPNKETHVLFNAARDDPDFVTSHSPYDVVADGNQVLGRTLQRGEKTLAMKRLPGRPKKKKAQRTVKSRRAAVSSTGQLPSKRRKTGGVFATVNMKPAGKGKGYEILQLTEMLNGEGKKVKERSIEDMKASGIKIGKWAHDCACRYKKWEG